MKKLTFKKTTEIAASTISRLLSLFVVLALIIGTAKIFLDIGKILEGTIDDGFKILVTDILGLIVALELFRGLMDYIELHRVRLSIITEVTLVFVLREVMILLYQHKLMWKEMFALAFLIAVLGGLRTLALMRSPGRLIKSGIKNDQS